jgi:hypothetical protein
MKKLFYLAVAALLAMNVTLTSCSKDDDNDSGAPDSLAGTTWVFTAGGNSLTISFTELLYELTMAGPDVENLSGMGFYTYTKPNVVLKLGVGDEAEEIRGVVNGDKLSLTLAGDTIVLTKK